MARKDISRQWIIIAALFYSLVGYFGTKVLVISIGLLLFAIVFYEAVRRPTNAREHAQVVVHSGATYLCAMLFMASGWIMKYF